MAQRAPITQAEKQMICQKKATGESLVEISRAMHCSFQTVRKWWRIARDQRQVRARGRPKRGPLSTYPAPVSERAIELKKEHAHWGPKRVVLELQKVLSLGEAELPSAGRTLVRFVQATLSGGSPAAPTPFAAPAEPKSVRRSPTLADGCQRGSAGGQ